MYLLDTSAISAIFNPHAAKHGEARTFQAEVAGREEELRISVISLAEMEFGLQLFVARVPPPSKVDQFAIRDVVTKASDLEPFEVDRHVAKEHGELRAKWARHIAPKKAAEGKLKGAQPERWSEDWPAVVLQITENDLWIAATALTFDLTLVTIDRDFTALSAVDKNLRVRML